MAKTKVILTDGELGLLSLALLKLDALATLGVIQNPWAEDHDFEETSWLLLKMNMMRDEFEPQRDERGD